ncbi:ribosomal protein S5 [Blyttiomyces sp. JEL0837]|nr:ribosomal protein S5 [Blyttiomyces sp. JEL0837]
MSKFFKVCIVGSGPAGFYTTQYLLKHPLVSIDVFERYPVPFGLARYGISPDHQDAKNVTHKFAKLLSDERVRLVGNVNVGKDVEISELLNHYNAVVLAYGAGAERELGLPHEKSARGFYSGQAFVDWYNGVPDKVATHNFHLDNAETAIVIGHGNVALDIARMLLRPVDQLAKSDITENALEVLAASRIKRVQLVGRRGPLQMAFTSKELREMIHLPGVTSTTDIGFIRDHIATLKQLGRPIERARQRLCDVLLENKETGSGRRTWSIEYLKSPVDLTLDHAGKVTGLKVEENQFLPDFQHVQGTGRTEVMPADIVIRSIGYIGTPMPGVPFDAKRGVIPNVFGRVVSTEGQPLDRLYTAGWIKRGAVGVIAATMYDAQETADTIMQDCLNSNFAKVDGFNAVSEMLKRRAVQVTDINDWKRIDEKEVIMGATRGKPREKLVSLADIVEMDKYKRRDVEQSSTTVDDGLSISISNFGKVKEYATLVLAQLEADTENKGIVLTGRGKAINKVITVAEIVKRQSKGTLEQDTRIFSDEVEEVWEPKEGDLDW